MLVILGLLVGGVLTGQSLIRAAELRSVTTEFQKYQAAVNNFRDKYFALPGDMTNAISFWGAAHATPATCITTAGTGTQTCNGNGDGMITTTGSAGSNEAFRFWQHLANAGLIEGTYSGITDGSTTFSATKTNTPSGKLSNSLWYAITFGNVSGASTYFNGNYGGAFQFGGVAANQRPTGSIFRPEEIWNIDTKIDDGKPATGKLVVYAAGGTSTCTTTLANDPTTLSAEYLLTSTNIACNAKFIQLY